MVEGPFSLFWNNGWATLNKIFQTIGVFKRGLGGLFFYSCFLSHAILHDLGQVFTVTKVTLTVDSHHSLGA